MQKKSEIVFVDNRLLVMGDITCFNAMTIYKKSLSYLNKISELEFDFAQVKTTDSAAIALLIEWLKFAKTKNKSIRFYNLPQDILSLAKAAGMDKMLSK